MINKKNIFMIFLLFINCLTVYALNTYKTSPEDLFLSTLSIVSAEKYTIKEFNSTLGEIIYTTNNNEYFIKINGTQNSSQVSITKLSKNQYTDNSKNTIYLKLDTKYGTNAPKQL